MRRLLFLFVLPLLLAGCTNPPTQDHTINQPTAKIEQTPTGHAIFDNVLKTYVKKADINRVDYAALQKNPTDLEEYLTYLTNIDLNSLNNKERMVTLFNAYNAYTLKLVINEYPLKSLIDLENAWDQPIANIGGTFYTLNQIEHDILRKEYNEPRIHFAVNCASYGCPNIQPEAFTTENLERLMAQGAKDYINHPRGITINHHLGTITISSLFDWYKEDFKPTPRTYIATYLTNPEDKTYLNNHTREFKYEYDWQLNDTN